MSRTDSTLTKGLAILEGLAASPRGRGVTELSRDLALTKSNTFRLLRTLTALGYVKQLEDQTYAATLKTWQVGRMRVETLNLRDMAARDLAELGRGTGETVYLAVPENLEVVYIDKIESQKPIRSWNPIGGSAPIHAVSTGKAIIAANYRTMRPRLLGHLDRYTEKTVTSIDALDADVAETRRRGYATDRGEFRQRVVGYGATIELPDGTAIAAVGISLPDINLPDGGEARYAALVCQAAERISQKLGRG